jgi:putative tryptophan/tyrosine transport system substrate-binding protein
VLVPVPAPAQRAGTVYRVGLFHVGLDHVPPSLEPLRAALKALGYEQQGNLRFDWRNLADERAARDAARDFVAQPVDVIVAFENVTARAAKVTTTTLPVVFVHVTDPVRDGFVKSLAHPGGNLTGFSGVGDAAAKEIELLTEAVPRTRRILVLQDAHDPTTARRLEDMRSAASRLNVTLLEREVSDVSSIERAELGEARRRGRCDRRICGSAFEVCRGNDAPGEHAAPALLRAS